MKVRYQHQQTLPDGRVVQHDYEGAGPMLSDTRASNYILHNLVTSPRLNSRRLTVRQERQLRKASKRLLYRGSRAAS